MFVRSVSFVARLVGAAACACLLTAVAAPPAVADEFSEYRIPAQSWQSGSGQFSVSGSRMKADVHSAESEQSRTAGYGMFGGSFNRGFDSDSRLFRWSVGGTSTSEFTHVEASDITGPLWTWSESRWQEQAQSLGASTAVRLHPGGGLLGFELGGRVIGRWWQNWGRGDDESGNPSSGYQQLSRHSTQNRRNQYEASLSGGTGLGRVRDVTVVEDVHVMEQRLRTSGALSRPLTPGARARLAGVLAASGVLSYAHDRYERYRWREVERVLAEDGALGPGGLDAYAVRLAADPTMARPRRSRGYFVGLEAVAEHWHDIYRSETQDRSLYVPGGGGSSEYQTRSSARQSLEYDRAYLGVRAEWHRPVGWAWQWDAAARVLTPIRPGEQGTVTWTQLSGSWHIADRWLAQATADHQRQMFAPRDSHQWTEDNWQFSQQLGVDYFVEDHVSIGLTLTDRQFRLRHPNYLGPTYSTYQRELRLMAGVNWTFLGRAEAPGLFGPLTRGD